MGDRIVVRNKDTREVILVMNEDGEVEETEALEKLRKEIRERKRKDKDSVREHGESRRDPS